MIQELVFYLVHLTILKTKVNIVENVIKHVQIVLKVHGKTVKQLVLQVIKRLCIVHYHVWILVQLDIY